MTIRAGLLRQIGPIPEAIRIQADEYLFTLAAVLTTVLILPQALTYYRLHEANLFQLSGRDPLQLRSKQESLSILATALSQRMDALGIEFIIRQGVLAYTLAYSDQLRLMLDGGSPWETATTEWKLYRVTHPKAPLSHRFFKFLSLIGALGMTPKTYYAAQRAFAQSDTLQRARKRWLPIPEMPHIQKRTDL